MDGSRHVQRSSSLLRSAAYESPWQSTKVCLAGLEAAGEGAGYMFRVTDLRGGLLGLGLLQGTLRAGARGLSVAQHRLHALQHLARQVALRHGVRHFLGRRQPVCPRICHLTPAPLVLRPQHLRAAASLLIGYFCNCYNRARLSQYSASGSRFIVAISTTAG